MPVQVPPSKAPKPPRGPWADSIVGQYYFYCENNKVYSKFLGTVSVPGRPCTPNASSSIVPILGSDRRRMGSTGGESEVNCNPLINTTLQQSQQAKSHARSDPPINSTPPVTGTAQAASGAGPLGNTSPVTFWRRRCGNLGLINGQSGNDGYTPAEAAQMVSTIATFDQIEADLAGIFATASGQGGEPGHRG